MMGKRNFIIWGTFFIVTLLFSHGVLAQGNGFIGTSEGSGLPPGAVYEGSVVLHPISSAQENLHLLAGFYYGNPREWKRIYQDNRHVIRNPNRLQVGETLKIQVGDNWKPNFSYEEWFQLANRNGQWESGKSWKRARVSSNPVTPAAVESTPPQRASETPTIPQTVPKIEPVKPAEVNSGNAPVQQEAPPEKSSPPVETPAVKEEAPIADDSPTEETPSEEEAPAF